MTERQPDFTIRTDDGSRVLVGGDKNFACIEVWGEYIDLDRPNAIKLRDELNRVLGDTN